MKQFLEIGKIVNTHGVKGVVKSEAWCDSPKVLAKLKTVYIKKNVSSNDTVAADGSFFLPLNVGASSVHKGYVLIHPEGSTTFEDAIKYKNTVIYALREDISHDSSAVFISDMIGLPVIDYENNTVYGYLRDVIKGTAQDVYEIELLQKSETETGKNKTGYLPAVSEFVKKIDIENGIFISLIPGMFD